MAKTKFAAVCVIVTTLFVCVTISSGANTTTVSHLGQQKGDEFLSILQKLTNNPNIVGDFVQSIVPAITNILKSSVGGTNSTSNQPTQIEYILRQWLTGMSGMTAARNASSFLPTGIDLGQFVGTAEQFLENPTVQKTLLPVVLQVTSILREEITKHNNGTFPSLTSLPAVLGDVGANTVLQRLVQAGIPQKLIQSLPHGYIHDACFRDTVDTLEGLLTMEQWALDMFDATGKIESGIQKGHFYFIGSYDQCYEAKPQVKTTYTGGRTSVRAFGTHFCRADIKISDRLVKSLNVDTRGVELKLTWGLCLPDACKAKDVKVFFEAGKEFNLSIPLGDVYCYEDEDLGSDISAIVAICILSVIGLLITLGTIIDAYRAYITEPDSAPDKQAKPADLSSEKYKQAMESTGDLQLVEGKYTKTESPSIPVDTQAGLGNDKTVNGGVHVDTSDYEIPLPIGYVPHKETGIEIVTSDRLDNRAVIQHTTDRHDKKRKDAFAVRMLLCFSFYTNIPKILNAKVSSGSVACIHGIRFFSLTWVVLGHTYNYGIISMEETLNAANLLDFVGILQRFTYQTIVAGGFAVDTFFVLSAFLLTWLHLKDKTKKKKNCTLWDSIYFYFHRFWRLTPIYMFVLMAFACLYKYLGSGPMWPSSITTAENCKQYWWTNLLYVNNLVHLDNQCMGWSWYLANDMQFYVVSPIFLLAMLMSPVVGALLTCGLLALGMACAFWQEYVYNGNFFTMKEDGGDYWRKVYIVPWCRVGCWAVGMLLGLLVFRRGQNPLRNKIIVRLGWLLATAIALFLVYIPYTEQKNGGQEWTRVERAFYEGVGRPAWGMCVAWVIFACYFGKGGIVNTILSWNGFIPLSRLTYAAYLVHPICMMVNVWSRRTLLYVNDYTIIYLFLGHLCITYLVAFVCSLAFEAPFMALEKILFHRGRRT